MSKPFIYLLRVRYGECDAQSVVYNAKYAEFADIAVTEFMRAIWGGYANLLKRGIDSQVVDLHIRWQAPARFDDVIQMAVEVTHIGETSYTIRTTFEDYKTKNAIAEALICYVMVSTSDYKKCSLPSDIRQELEAGAPNVVVDHASAIK